MFWAIVGTGIAIGAIVATVGFLADTFNTDVFTVLRWGCATIFGGIVLSVPLVIINWIIMPILEFVLSPDIAFFFSIFVIMPLYFLLFGALLKKFGINTLHFVFLTTKETNDTHPSVYVYDPSSGHDDLTQTKGGKTTFEIVHEKMSLAVEGFERGETGSVINRKVDYINRLITEMYRRAENSSNVAPKYLSALDALKQLWQDVLSEKGYELPPEKEIKKVQNCTVNLPSFERNTGRQSKPLQPASSSVNYVHDPNSGYTDMRGLTAYNPQSDLESLDEQLRQLQMHARWEKIDSTTTRFLNDLANYDQSKYGEKLAEYEQFVSDMGRLFLRSVKNINKRIEVGYEKKERPDVNVDPAYRAAFKAKVQEVRDFLASLGR